MEEKGIISEIKDLNRFKYVLVTRSSPMEDVEQEKYINEIVEQMSNENGGKGQMSDNKEKRTAKRNGGRMEHLMVTPY